MTCRLAIIIMLGRLAIGLLALDLSLGLSLIIITLVSIAIEESLTCSAEALWGNAMQGPQCALHQKHNFVRARISVFGCRRVAHSCSFDWCCLFEMSFCLVGFWAVCHMTLSWYVTLSVDGSLDC
jgi:hypothetical protein